MKDRGDGDDDNGPAGLKGGRFFEFDCPECSAHNPYADGFRVADEVLCFYCGISYQVRSRDAGGFRLKPA